MSYHFHRDFHINNLQVVFTFIGTDPNVLITTRITFVMYILTYFFKPLSQDASQLSHLPFLSPIHPLEYCHIYNLTVLVCLLNEHYYYY